ncbi:formate dehydrogenase accessory sulfurtransferase FdhD [Sphingomonas naphthae]|uniref:Sulfur carrier protein FdhD n=1 Tax=Sphingomonas naphthae TaxID=1813468 RepID=A0ABY7TQL0_9SPHN|nr:formate dehydrogenase accessory sulfurtransferase FdhD [Sphingomonas naphthae]WCT74459.1 formate dehydrogenase accessory sulfurtransferase FdhD [Sphingomonas naphthae]
MTASVSAAFTRLSADSAVERMKRALAVEAPVAIEINGLGYAVLMASPIDLIDLAYGFLLTERLIEWAGEIVDVEPHETEAGYILRITAARPVSDRLAQRVRHRTSDASCGLCGIENLEQALRPLPVLANRWTGSDAAIFAALDRLKDGQPLNRETGAVHAAALCSDDGMILDVREDVGRHNAFDKLIGAMLRAGQGWGDGFALLTSRCSYELVEKAVLSGCPMLATISAPTDLAVRRAAEAGLALRVLARPDFCLATTP